MKYLKKNTLSRRRFLRGAGGVAVGLPFLNILGGCSQSSTARGSQRKHAETDGAPKRVLFVFSPNGTIHQNWAPTGGETDFALSEILMPLTPFREKLLILNGLDMKSTSNGPGDAHQKGMGHMLTGTALQEGDLFTGGGGELAGWGGGMSIDQRIANHIGGDRKFGSLELGAQVSTSANVWSRMSYSGPGQPLPPDDNPYSAFDRIFSDLNADPFELEQVRAKRGTVLDHVNRDFEALQAKVGQEDRDHLERHASTIRDLEMRLQSGIGELGAQCEAPELGAPIDHQLRENYPQVVRLQMDLAAMALTCDLTRVASLQLSNAVGGHVHSWLGHSRGHHDFSHDGDSNSDTRQKITDINTWYAEQFAYLLGKLDSVQEGDGTLLDNTVVVWVNELGKGNNHSRDNVPIVMAGSAGGHFRTGRYLNYGSRTHNNLWVSLQNAFGIEDDNFGDPNYCSGPLGNLT